MKATKYFSFVVVFILFVYLCVKIALSTIIVVQYQHLLPLWDPATHSLYGWRLYYYLSQFNLPMFLWSIWSEGLWPFMYYLYQLPLHLIIGSRWEGAAVSSLIGFMLAGLLSIFYIFKLIKNHAAIPSSVFIMFFISSPMYLAYSSLPMTEIFGSLIQLIVLTSYLLMNDSKSHKHAVLFSVSLTMLFFTKYNYFLLVAIPIIINEYLLYTLNWTPKEHFVGLLKFTKIIFSRLTGKLLFLYFIFISFIILTGGFEINIFDKKISIHSIGNTGYLVLYLLLIKLWVEYKKKRKEYAKIFSKDYRIKPLITYFVIPLIIWFAIPYPNHIKEFFGLVINRSTEEINFFSSIPYYFNVLRKEYFSNDIIFFVGLFVFFIAIINYRKQIPIIKFLIITSVIQTLFVVSHPYKSTRFIFLALIPLWLVISLELNRWFKRIDFRLSATYLFSITFIIAGIMLFNSTLNGTIFYQHAFNIYTKSNDLSNGFEFVRNQITSSDKIAVIGGIGNFISPALIELELGPRKSFGEFIGVVSPDKYKKLNDGTHLLTISPGENNTDIEITESFALHSDKISKLLADRNLILIGERRINDLNLLFKVFKIVNVNHL